MKTSEPVVMEKFRRLNLDMPVLITTSDENGSEQTRVVVGRHKKQKSYMDFCYNPAQKVIECARIEVAEELRGQGLGSLLVETMEDAGKALGCESVRINGNGNKRKFWEKRDYQLQGQYWEKILR